MYEIVENYKAKIYIHQKIINNWENWSEDKITKEELDELNKKLREELKNLL